MLPRIRAKTRPPQIPATVAARPRLDYLIRDLLVRHRTVWIVASAGAGKTTAAVGAARLFDGHVAWLTLQNGDAVPGRFLTYLEAGLLDALDSVEPTVASGLAAGLRHDEVAGLLAESVPDKAPVLLVLDELERIAESPDARAVLESFLRFAPRSMHVLLISRRSIDARGHAFAATHAGHLGEADLRFTLDEAEKALALRGADDATDVADAVQATGGWVTGVLFEAWRSKEHVYGAGGEVDPLSGYLSSEIMSALPYESQRLLIHTSLLDEVTVESSRLLGVHEPARAMSALTQFRLPITPSESGGFRCHPRFREYLQERLLEEEESTIQQIRTAHAHLLAREGRYEEAVESYLGLGQWQNAAGTAELIAMDVMARFDVPVIERWISDLPASQVESSPVLLAAALLAAVEREEYLLGASFADQLLDKIGDLERLPVSISGIFGPIAWCYFLVNRIDDARTVLRGAPDSSQVRIMEFAINVELIDSPVHYHDRPPPSGTAVDGMLTRIDLAHGRFRAILESDFPGSPSVHSSRVGALIGLGRLEEAQLAFEERPPFGWTMVRHYNELMTELNRPEEAWAALIKGRELLNRSGAGLFDMFSLLAEVRLALRFRRDTDQASAALNLLEREPTARQRIRTLEQIDLWRGLIALLKGDAAGAAERLRAAVDLMKTWERYLFLPTAAVYLSEAEWRLNNVEAADEAAGLALAISLETGSTFYLLQALREFPSVVSRSLDGEPGVDSEWHRIGRQLLHEGVEVYGTLLSKVELAEFRSPSIHINGERRVPKLAKSLELLAFLCASKGEVQREDVLDALFDGRNDDSAKAYLRMAISRLREVLPADATIEALPDLIRWSGTRLPVSQSEQICSRARQAQALDAESRLEVLTEVLDLLDLEYFPMSHTPWIVDRREELASLAVDLRHEAGEAAYSCGEFALADQLAVVALASAPYRESTWRLRMKIAAALGDSDRVIALFEQCRRALAEVPVDPAESTVRLVNDLRR